MKERNSEPEGSHNKQWGQDIIKAKLTQSLRGEEMGKEKKIMQAVTHIVTAILSALMGYFGAN